MRKTLLLCFIHGFKGGDDTFGSRSEFAEHLAALLSAALPRIDVRAVTYPRYETRGDLGECVARFRDWLLERVIDLEVAAGSASPTVDPSVRVVLVGHSMGGIVAAETALGIAGEKPVAEGADNGDEEAAAAAASGKGELNTLMFPYIQGVLAFDTPFLGIAPGVVAHGAEGNYNKASAALTQLSGLSGMFFGGGAAAAAGSNQQQRAPAGQLPPAAAAASEAESKNKKGAEGGGGGWGNWGKMAMYAGAAGALAAGGAAAAYAGRERIGDGWSWVGSHLAFVGCLARGEELRARVAGMARLERELGVGFANLYTRLGRRAGSTSTVSGTLLGSQRTFCNLPKRMEAGTWLPAVNDRAEDETGAHMAMFEPSSNPGYEQLSEDAKSFIAGWAQNNEWYESSSEEILAPDAHHGAASPAPETAPTPQPSEAPAPTPTPPPPHQQQQQRVEEPNVWAEENVWADEGKVGESKGGDGEVGFQTQNAAQESLI